MYEKDIAALHLQRYVLDNMKVTDKGVAYYVLEDKDLKELNIHNERGKEYLSLMSGIKGVPIWFCVTEIIENKSSNPNTIIIENSSKDDFLTLKDYAFVVGEDEPAISLLEVNK